MFNDKVEELVQPLANMLELDIDISSDVRLSAWAKKPLDIIGVPVELPICIVNSCVNVTSGVAHIAIQIGTGVYLLAVYEKNTETVYLWVTSKPVTAQGSTSWSRVHVYSQLAECAVKLYVGYLEDEEEFMWGEMTNPADRCKMYLDLRARGAVSPAAMAKAFDL